MVPFEPSVIKTHPDQYGVYRVFQNLPSRCPDDDSQSLGDVPTFSTAYEPQQYLANSFLELQPNEDSNSSVHDKQNWYAPFQHPTSFRLMNWYSDAGGKLSLSHLDRLYHDVLKADDFDIQHLDGFSAQREARRLDDNNATADSIFSSHVWMESSVYIRLPKDGLSWKSEDEAPQFEIKDIHHQSFLKVIKTAFQDSQFLKFHLWGCKEIWKPADNSPEDRLFGEVFTANAFLEAEQELLSQEHEALRTFESDSSGSSDGNQPSERDSSSGSSDSTSESDASSYATYVDSSKLRSSTPIEAEFIPWLMVPIMIYSDSTCVNNFGDTSLWPVYIFFLGLSKYLRSKPTSGTAHHFAYIPSVNIL
ncbi:hypothetical protein VKT23_016369 [Stygiomarasmius scandens]|uniref:Uncharacterized protein n=1 Tax=Marasmiellus scandens TaxID=2682957 RepID=A0ABR1IV42_9AGAR